MSTLKNTTLPDRCPEHDSPVMWYATPEVQRMNWMEFFEVARYDCSCIITRERDTMEAKLVREVISKPEV